MIGRALCAALPSGLAVLALGAGAAQAASEKVTQAVDTVQTLLIFAFLVWVVGNLLTKHTYSTRGPKGDKLPPAQ